MVVSWGMVVSRSTFSEMLSYMREVYGSGGNVIAYQLGFSTGKRDADELIRVLGKERVLENLPGLMNIYLAQGWGVAELVDLAPDPFQAIVRLSDSFECAGVRAVRSNSHFLRGHLAGAAKTFFDKNVECIEVRCSATGNDFCEFHCVEA
jgi:predicted hydrocarbon binding protein